MRPLFTVHAGEFVVGEHIEKEFKNLNVWIPAKDTGVDLLITDASARETVSLQVKLSRDYRQPEATEEFDRNLLATGWLTLNHEKLEASPADLWVILLVSHERKSRPQFVVIPPAELLARLVAIHGPSKNYHFYPWVTKDGRCMQGRGLGKADRASIAKGTLDLGLRDLSAFLDDWSALKRLDALTKKSQAVAI